MRSGSSASTPKPPSRSTTELAVRLLAALALALAVGLAACTGPALPAIPDVETGVVVAVDGPSAAEVERFSLRTADGRVREFVVGRLDLTNGGLPAPHLRDHLVSGEPVTVYYYAEEVIRYTDAE